MEVSHLRGFHDRRMHLPRGQDSVFTPQAAVASITCDQHGQRCASLLQQTASASTFTSVCVYVFFPSMIPKQFICQLLIKCSSLRGEHNLLKTSQHPIAKLRTWIFRDPFRVLLVCSSSSLRPSQEQRTPDCTRSSWAQSECWTSTAA